MPTMLTHILLYAALLPLVTSASIALIMRRLRSPSQIAWPVAITGGFLAAQLTLRGHSGFSDSLRTFLNPHDAVDWLPHIALLALGLSLLMYLAPSHRRRLIALAVALCLAAPVRLLSGNVAQHWSVLEKVAVLVSVAGVLGLVWLLLARNNTERPAILRVPLLVLVALGTAIVVTESGVFIYGLSSAALGAAITGTALAFLGATGSASALRRGASSGIESTSGVITLTLGSLILLTHFYAELSTTSAALLLFSLTATAARLPAFLRTGPVWQPNTAGILLCVLPLAIAVVSVVT